MPSAWSSSRLNSWNSARRQRSSNVSTKPVTSRGAMGCVGGQQRGLVDADGARHPQVGQVVDTGTAVVARCLHGQDTPDSPGHRRHRRCRHSGNISARARSVSTAPRGDEVGLLREGLDLIVKSGQRHRRLRHTSTIRRSQMGRSGTRTIRQPVPDRPAWRPPRCPSAADSNRSRQPAGDVSDGLVDVVSGDTPGPLA